MSEQDLENGLANLVGCHADWLDGESFMRICTRTAYAYFDGKEVEQGLIGVASQPVIDAITEAFRKASA